MSTRAEDVNSTLAKPLLNFSAARILSSSACGIGSPVSWCTAKRRSTSGTVSQCSNSCEGSSTKSRATEVPEIEAEYTLEAAVKCCECHAQLQTVNVIRLLRTKVNFTSSLPRRGYVVVCPACRKVIPAGLG